MKRPEEFEFERKAVDAFIKGEERSAGVNTRFTAEEQAVQHLRQCAACGWRGEQRDQKWSKISGSWRGKGGAAAPNAFNVITQSQE